jgi:hypothetical protein
MTVIYCDITKKPIENATTTYTWETRENRYDTLKSKDLSVEGKAKLDATIHNAMEERKIFSFGEWKQVTEDALNKLTR